MQRSVAWTWKAATGLKWYNKNSLVCGHLAVTSPRAFFSTLLLHNRKHTVVQESSKDVLLQFHFSVTQIELREVTVCCG